MVVYSNGTERRGVWGVWEVGEVWGVGEKLKNRRC